MRMLLPLLLAASIAAGCSSSAEPTLSKEDQGKMKNWLEKGIPAEKSGLPPAKSSPLPKNDSKTGTPTD